MNVNPLNAQSFTPAQLEDIDSLLAPTPDSPPIPPVTTIDLLTPDRFFALRPDYHRAVSPHFSHDHDGDSIADFSIPLIGLGGVVPLAGSLVVYSGWTGHELFTITGVEPNDMFGFSSLGVRDISGDQRPDFLVGAPASDLDALDAGSAYIHSGADGESLIVIRGKAPGGAFGFALTDVADLDGDGASEVVISAPFDGAGKVFIFLSSSLKSVDGSFHLDRTTDDADLVLAGEAAGDLFGFSIASAGDVNGDGYDDLVVGAPGSNHIGATGVAAGKAYLYSGFDSSLLGSITIASAGDLLGYSVASAGDIDGDGRADIVLGAPGDPDHFDRGRAHIFHSSSLFDAGQPFAPRSSADADLSLSAAVGGSSTAGDTLFGLFVALGNDSGADGDSDFDGVRDIVVHAGVRDEAGVMVGARGYVFSGAGGSFLYTFTADDAPPPSDPPGDPGGDEDQLTPFDGPDGAALIETIIDNMGMEGATLAHGDLDDTTVVTVDDLLLAIEIIATGGTTDGAAAATQHDEQCLEIAPDEFDENGDPVMRPCQDPDDTTGGGGNNNNDPNGGYPAGGRCANYYQIGWIPTNGEQALSWKECFMRGICALADAKDQGKAGAKAERDAAVAQTRAELDTAIATAQGTRDQSVGISKGALNANLVVTALATAGALAVEIRVAKATAPAEPIAWLGTGEVIAGTLLAGGAAMAVSVIDYSAAVDQADLTMAADPIVGIKKDAHNEQITQSDDTLRNTCAQLEIAFDESRRMLCASCDRDFDRPDSVPSSYCQ